MFVLKLNLCYLFSILQLADAEILELLFLEMTSLRPLYFLDNCLLHAGCWPETAKSYVFKHEMLINFFPLFAKIKYSEDKAIKVIFCVKSFLIIAMKQKKAGVLQIVFCANNCFRFRSTHLV